MLFFEFNKRYTYGKQFIAVSTAAVGLISSGMEFGWSSPAVPILLNKTRQLPPVILTPTEASWISTLYVLGSICCLPISYLLLQHVGRKRALLIAKSVSLLCWLLLGTSRTMVQLFIARFFSGVAENVLFVALPMYITEITEPQVRGFFASFTYITTMIGIVVVYSIVPFIPFYASSAVGAGIALLMISTFVWQPESPYFLMLKGRDNDARNSLQRLRHSTYNIDSELESIANTIEEERNHHLQQQEQRQQEQQSENNNNNNKQRRWYQIVVDVIRIPSNRKALMIMLLLNGAQNWGGCTVITMNAHELITSSMNDENSMTYAIIFAVVMLIATLIGAVTIDRFGRKTLIVSSCIITAILLSIFATYLLLDLNTTNNSYYTYIPLVVLVMYAFAFKYGMGLAPIVLTGELFAPEVKPVGMIMSDLWFTIQATISLQFYYLINNAYGMYLPFYVFAAFSLLTGLLVGIWVPETKGHSLQEIQQVLKRT